MDDADLDLLLRALNASGDATTAIADVIAIDKGMGDAPNAETAAAGMGGLLRAQKTLQDSARILLDAADVIKRRTTIRVIKQTDD